MSSLLHLDFSLLFDLNQSFTRYVGWILLLQLLTPQFDPWFNYRATQVAVNDGFYVRWIPAVVATLTVCRTFGIGSMSDHGILLVEPLEEQSIQDL